MIDKNLKAGSVIVANELGEESIRGLIIRLTSEWIEKRNGFHGYTGLILNRADFPLTSLEKDECGIVMLSLYDVYEPYKKFTKLKGIYGKLD